ncbi:hypothetical protein QQZ08_003286 [Neonectria magnoliae]|uniref:Myb-like DNA-binding domain protein n=1 Tax=Neonectria magnoliae TaxID=2732573 RepID=A0ABR1IB23_9HYPO
MEPPAKRRRQGPSPLKNNPEPTKDANDDRPKDDGHQLAIKRAQADHKLQATFAHIIEKYSQDFDGIGDEIDMETGEIVVNNGHLSGMRHEGDLGGGAWPDDASDGYGNEGDDDDDGILLEDLTDEMFNADDEDVSEIQDSEEADNEDPADQDPTETDSHEEELVLPRREMVSKPTSLIPQSGSGASNMPSNFLGAQVEVLNSLFPNLYGSLFVGFLPAPGTQPAGFAPGFGLPQLNNGTSPVSYGQQAMGYSPNPFLVGPWAMPGHLPPQTWGNPEMPVQQQLFPKQHTKKSTAERYKFPTQKGDTSIWAPRSRQQDDDKPVPLPKGRPRKPREQKSDTGHSPNDDGKFNSKNDAGSGRDDHRSRRLSSRVRKQVKYMGKISWQEAEKDQGLNMNESSQLSDSDSDPIALHSSQGGQETTSQSLGVTTPKSAQTIRKLLRPGSIAKPNLGRVVPDSQDSATPPGSSAPQSSGPKEDDTYVDKPSHTSVNSTAKLSDDEAPIVLPIRKTPKIPTELDPAPNIDDHDLGGDEPELVLTPVKPKKRGRGRPPKPPIAEHEPESGRAKTVIGLPPLRLSREMKWLQASLQSTPKSTPVLDLSNAAEETVQEQGLGSAKRLRSVTSRASIKHDNVPVEGPEEIGEADRTDGVDGLEGANEDEEAGETGEAEGAEDVEDAEESGDVELTAAEVTCSAAAIEMTTPPSPPPSLPPATALPATASPPTKKASSKKQDEPPPHATQEETPRKPPNPKQKSAPIHNPSQATPQKPTHTPSKPHTPRLTSIRTSRAPSSRRSLLSLISADSDSDSDNDCDELGRPSPSLPRSAGASTIKAWRSSALTTEAIRTPSRKRHGEPISPGSVVRTPGGTMRACGVGGFRCGRDFCFSCL